MQLAPLLKLRTLATQSLPWAITAVALYIAFKDVDFKQLRETARQANITYLALACCLTALSYTLRARRWQILYPHALLSFANSWRVLTLGFFMNNVLPARTGELVRAHMGSQITGDKRTLVLATIACERLADGLCLSVLFVLFAFSASSGAIGLSLQFASLGFAGITVIIALIIWGKSWFDQIFEGIRTRLPYTIVRYGLNRLDLFIGGLRTLFCPSLWPKLTGWTVLIWLVEALVYFITALAFSQTLSIEATILFLVAVNFSSLIPAAPGGFGVIEAVASASLISVGIEREAALAMVIAQHLIQYLIVGIPGAAIMLCWQKTLAKVKAQIEETEDFSPTIPSPEVKQT